jgi:hypothetical protein
LLTPLATHSQHYNERLRPLAPGELEAGKGSTPVKRKAAADGAISLTPSDPGKKLKRRAALKAVSEETVEGREAGDDEEGDDEEGIPVEEAKGEKYEQYV